MKVAAEVNVGVRIVGGGSVATREDEWSGQGLVVDTGDG